MRREAIVLRALVSLEAIIHRARLECIAKVVAGVLAARQLALTAVGRALLGRAATKHAIKCVDRLLGNPHVQREIALFQALFAQHIPREGRPVLLIDWTDIGTKWAALVVTLVADGRGTVLCWEAHPRSRENNPRVESSILKRIERLLPNDCRPILVTDAGFRGPWLRKTLESGWDFVGRVRGRVKARRCGTKDWRSAKSLWLELSGRPSDLGEHELAKYLPVRARLVGVWKNKCGHTKPLPAIGRRKKRSIRSAREPWVLATSLSGPPREIVGLYAMRMRIEQTFRDQKCPRLGLGLDAVKTNVRARIDAYLLLAALAHYIAMQIGAAAEAAGLHRRFQANTVQGRRVLSLARLGREILQHMSDLNLITAALRSPLATVAYAARIHGDP